MGDPRLALMFAWHGALRGALIYVSRVIFASMGKFLILVVVGVGGWALGYHSMGFGHFPDIS